MADFCIIFHTNQGNMLVINNIAQDLLCNFNEAPRVGASIEIEESNKPMNFISKPLV